MQIIRCISCNGFGSVEDDFTGEQEECDWCLGVGYVYRNQQDVDSPIPKGDYTKVSDELEKLETERMRELGYQGNAKKPWQQDIRKDTKLGEDPYLDDSLLN